MTVSSKGKPGQQLMSMLWAEDEKTGEVGRIFQSTYTLIRQGLVSDDGLTVRLTDEGRQVARALMATPEGQAYMQEMGEEVSQ